MKIQTPFQQFKEKYFGDKVDSNGDGIIVIENENKLSFEVVKVNVLNFYNNFNAFTLAPSQLVSINGKPKYPLHFRKIKE